jgi:hypothetical protein
VATLVDDVSQVNRLTQNVTVQVGEVGAWLLLPLIFLVATVLSSPLIFSASLQTLLDIFVSQRTFPNTFL